MNNRQQFNKTRHSPNAIYQYFIICKHKVQLPHANQITVRFFLSPPSLPAYKMYREQTVVKARYRVDSKERLDAICEEIRLRTRQEPIISNIVDVYIGNKDIFKHRHHELNGSYDPTGQFIQFHLHYDSERTPFVDRESITTTAPLYLETILVGHLGCDGVLRKRRRCFTLSCPPGNADGVDIVRVDVDEIDLIGYLVSFTSELQYKEETYKQAYSRLAVLAATLDLEDAIDPRTPICLGLKDRKITEWLSVCYNSLNPNNSIDPNIISRVESITL